MRLIEQQELVAVDEATVMHSKECGLRKVRGSTALTCAGRM